MLRLHPLINPSGTSGNPLIIEGLHKLSNRHGCKRQISGAPKLLLQQLIYGNSVIQRTLRITADCQHGGDGRPRRSTEIGENTHLFLKEALALLQNPLVDTLALHHIDSGT